MKPEGNKSVSKYYPDIVLVTQDGYIVSNSKNKFVYPFKGIKRNHKNMDTVEVWLEMMAKRHWLPISVRGYHPLAVSTREWEDGILTDSSDLTAIYRHILCKFR